ncbi:MAG: hypothetical protein WDO18_11800 [Acidobacteriota bacterium]
MVWCEGIVVAQQGARGLAAPAEGGAGHESEEIRKVDFVEDGEQVVMLALGAVHELAAAHFADLVELRAHVAAVEVAAIGAVTLSRNGTPEEFRQQDLGQGLLDLGGALRRGESASFTVRTPEASWICARALA